MQSTNFFKIVLKLSPWFSSMLDKIMKLFSSPHFTIFSHPPNPQCNDASPHPRFNDGFPLWLCLIIAPGVRGFMRSQKKVSKFCRRLNSRFDKSLHYFLDFSCIREFWKNVKLEIENLDFGFWHPHWPVGPPRGGAQGRHHHKGGNSGAVLTKRTRWHVSVDSGRRDRQEVVFWNEKTVHLLVFYPCKKSTFLSFRQEVVFWHKKTMHLLMFYSAQKTTNSQRSTVDGRR